MTTEHPIAVFLRARIDEAAAEAQETLDRNAAARARRMGSTLWDEEDARASWTLRKVMAMREILDDLIPEIESKDSAIEQEWGVTSNAAERLLRLLAALYSDHPDYVSAVGTVGA